MRKQGAERLTLTSRLLMLSTAIVVGTMLLVMLALSISFYDTAQEQVAGRQAPYASAAASELSGHLAAVAEAVESIAADPALSEASSETVGAVLASALNDNETYLRGIALVAESGSVVASQPSRMVPAGIESSLSPAQQTATYVWQDDPAHYDDPLWIVLPIDSTGSRLLLVASVRTDFIGAALGRVSAGGTGRTAVLLSGDARVIDSAGALSVDDATVFAFPAVGGSEPEGRAEIRGASPQIGYWREIAEPPSPGWRVVVTESREQAIAWTWNALLPGILGTIAALAASLAVSLAVVSRAIRPLRRLECRARALAAGVAVPQEAVDEGGEIGGLLEAFNSVVHRLNRMSDVAELMTDTPDRWLVLEAVTSSIHGMLESVDVEVLLLGDDRRLEFVAAEGALAARVGTTLPLDDVPWLAAVIESGTSALVSSPSGIRDALGGLHAVDGVTTALAVALRVGADVFGVLIVLRRGGRSLDATDVETVRAFAAQASMALHNWRLLQDERQSCHEAEVLWEIAEHVAAPGALGESLDGIAGAAAGLLGFDRSHAILCDHELYGLQPSASDPRTEAWLTVWRTLGEGTDADWLFLDADQLAQTPLAEDADARAALIVPLRRDTTLAGLIVMLTAEAREVPVARRLALAVTAGRQASIALQNAYLYEQAKRRADNLEMIFRISQAVSSSLQDRIVLNRVLDVVQKMLPVDAIMLLTYDANTGRMTVPMARGIMDQAMLDLSLRPGEDVPGRVFVTREPERYDHLAAADTALLNMASAHGLSSLLAVPLLARGRSIGVLVVFARAEAAFTIGELDLLRTFASQAALAIDTARMFGREHHVATVLQESILPTRLPRIPGIDAGSVYLPAGGEAEIGGDYYDLFTAPDGRAVISIGDVCGKGVVAATKTSMIKYSVRGMVAAGLEPARILAELNTMIMDTHDPSSIVTLWIGQVDLDTGALVYANGGHPAGLLLRPDRHVDRLGPTGALLGAVAEATWTQHDVPLGDAATLLLYTDGVTEARNGLRFFGEGRVRRALRFGGSATAVTKRVLADVRRFSSGDLRDDAAILALVYHPVELRTPGVSDVTLSGISTRAHAREEWRNDE